MLNLTFAVRVVVGSAEDYRKGTHRYRLNNRVNIINSARVLDQIGEEVARFCVSIDHKGVCQYHSNLFVKATQSTSVVTTDKRSNHLSAVSTKQQRPTPPLVSVVFYSQFKCISAHSLFVLLSSCAQVVGERKPVDHFSLAASFFFFFFSSTLC